MWKCVYCNYWCIYENLILPSFLISAWHSVAHVLVEYCVMHVFVSCLCDIYTVPCVFVIGLVTFFHCYQLSIVKVLTQAPGFCYNN